MSKAFVDTTILADILLKPGDERKRGTNALKRFVTSELPVYAIKEFKAGALKNYAWFHNNLVLLKSFAKAMAALQRMSLTPRKYTVATALSALAKATAATANTSLEKLAAKYGSKASIDSILCDRYRLSIKRMIYDAWANRRKVTTNVVLPLSCYDEIDPIERNGLLELDPRKCRVTSECCMGPSLKSAPNVLEKLRNAVTGMPDKPENRRRLKVLKELIRKPKSKMTDEDCRNLGDAIFAFFCPPQSVILTTNLVDHKPLAEALGKKVESP